MGGGGVDLGPQKMRGRTYEMFLEGGPLGKGGGGWVGPQESRGRTSDISHKEPLWRGGGGVERSTDNDQRN